jgi:hypothetical protein
MTTLLLAALAAAGLAEAVHHHSAAPRRPAPLSDLLEALEALEAAGHALLTECEGPRYAGPGVAELHRNVSELLAALPALRATLARKEQPHE